MIKEAIGALAEGRSLTMQEAASVMEEMMEGKATPAQLGAFITALKIKGETPQEIAGLASVMRAKATQVRVTSPVLDIVGTGGDGLNTFNISTASAFVAAGANIKVAKHGNRAASSKCGSADVLESLGINIDMDAEQVQLCIDRVGIGFMFAPNFHPAMKYAAGPRKEIGIRTVFNILGPLTNPAQAEYMVIGAPDIQLAEKIFSALFRLGVTHALVVHGMNGMDEISITGKSIYWELKDGNAVEVRKEICPESLGLSMAPLETILGGTPQENAGSVRSILSGIRGAKRDIVVMNAAAALLAGNKVKTIEDGIILAQEIIDQGKAREKMEQLIEYSQRLARTTHDS
jgi:anthranilate phosphoribosyltransferase